MIAMAWIGFCLSVVGLVWCWLVIHRQSEREKRRFTDAEIREMERRAA
jgi:hypothetical protein